MSNLEFNEETVPVMNRNREMIDKKSFLFKLVEKCGVPEKNVNGVLIVVAVLALILTLVVWKMSFSGPKRLTDEEITQYDKAHAIPRPKF